MKTFTHIKLYSNLLDLNGFNFTASVFLKDIAWIPLWKDKVCTFLIHSLGHSEKVSLESNLASFIIFYYTSHESNIVAFIKKTC